LDPLQHVHTAYTLLELVVALVLVSVGVVVWLYIVVLQPTDLVQVQTAEQKLDSLLAWLAIPYLPHY
jgi:prepilin-type N-terminal cleavage/methylation domain-containing protein